MKLSTYAKKLGLSYRTAWTMFKNGDVKGYSLPSGTIIIEDEKIIKSNENDVVLYARVSSLKQKNDLERQSQRLIDYSVAKGYKIYKVVKEIGSGLNDKRTKLNPILTDKKYSKIIVEHKDRLTRFGYNYIDLLMKEQGKEIEVINIPIDDKDDLVQDLVSLVTSFCARIYGHRRTKRKTEQIIEILKK
jgi:predicted site-specific integrase-resolvase